jgi:hypothetical protein
MSQLPESPNAAKIQSERLKQRLWLCKADQELAVLTDPWNQHGLTNETAMANLAIYGTNFRKKAENVVFGSH